ncbi:hypothetical protein WK68_32250 [Burkholderia ubonensis]|nr:hypothetical protein WK68_32250 [Burkholderia ubonensis]
MAADAPLTRQARAAGIDGPPRRRPPPSKSARAQRSASCMSSCHADRCALPRIASPHRPPARADS